MSTRITIKTCEFCGKTYDAKRCDSLYCSATCRKYAYIERERRHSGWSVSATYTSYKNNQEQKPDKQPIENEQIMDLMTIVKRELLKAMKLNGLS